VLVGFVSCLASSDGVACAANSPAGMVVGIADSSVIGAVCFGDDIANYCCDSESISLNSTMDMILAVLLLLCFPPVSILECGAPSNQGNVTQFGVGQDSKCWRAEQRR
jgi:hypothetical protein